MANAKVCRKFDNETRRTRFKGPPGKSLNGTAPRDDFYVRR